MALSSKELRTLQQGNGWYCETAHADRWVRERLIRFDASGQRWTLTKHGRELVQKHKA